MDEKRTSQTRPVNGSWSQERPTRVGWYWHYAPNAKPPRLSAVYFNGDWWQYGGISLTVDAPQYEGAYWMPLKKPTLPVFQQAQPTEQPKGERLYTKWHILWHKQGEYASKRSAVITTSLLSVSMAKSEPFFLFSPTDFIDEIYPIPQFSDTYKE